MGAGSKHTRRTLNGKVGTSLKILPSTMPAYDSLFSPNTSQPPRLACVSSVPLQAIHTLVSLSCVSLRGLTVEYAKTVSCHP